MNQQREVGTAFKKLAKIEQNRWQVAVQYRPKKKNAAELN